MAKKKLVVVDWANIVGKIDMGNPVDRKKLQKTLNSLNELRNKGIPVRIVIPDDKMLEAKNFIALFDSLNDQNDIGENAAPIFQIVPESDKIGRVEAEKKQLNITDNKDILYITTQQPSEEDKQKYDYCVVEKTLTERSLTPESYININKQATDEAPHIVFIGAGPAGLWAAIQAKLEFPEARLVFKEKRMDFQRRHPLRINKDSFTSAVKNPELEEVIADFSERGLVPTNEIQETFKHIAEKLGIVIDYTPVKSVATLRSEYPAGTIFLDTSGTKNVTEAEIFYKDENGEFKSEAEGGKQQYEFRDAVNHVVEVKYEVDSYANPYNRVLNIFKQTGSSPFLIEQSAGKMKNGKYPVIIRLFVSKEIYDKLMRGDGGTFVSPYNLSNPEHRSKIPTELSNAIQSLLKQREQTLGEKRSYDPNVTAIPLYLSSCADVYRILEDETIIMKGGDATSAAPYFVQFNVFGLKMGVDLAQKLALLIRIREYNFDLLSSLDKNAEKAKKEMLPNKIYFSDDGKSYYVRNSEGKVKEWKILPNGINIAAVKARLNEKEIKSRIIKVISKSILQEYDKKFRELMAETKKGALFKNKGINAAKKVFWGAHGLSHASESDVRGMLDKLPSNRGVKNIESAKKIRNEFLANVNSSKTNTMISSGKIVKDDHSFTLSISIYPNKENLKKAAAILSDVFKKYDYQSLVLAGENYHNTGWEGIGLDPFHPIDKQNPSEDNRGSEFRVIFSDENMKSEELKALMLKAWRALSDAGVEIGHLAPSRAMNIGIKDMDANIRTPFSYESSEDCSLQPQEISLQDVVDNRIDTKKVLVTEANESLVKRSLDLVESFNTIKTKLSSVDPTKDHLLKTKLIRLEEQIIFSKSYSSTDKVDPAEKLNIILQNKELFKILLEEYYLDDDLKVNKYVTELLNIVDHINAEYDKIMSNNPKANRQTTIAEISKNYSILNKITRLESLLEIIVESKVSDEELLQPMKTDPAWIAWLKDNSESIFKVKLSSDEEVIKAFELKWQYNPAACQEAHHAFHLALDEERSLKESRKLEEAALPNVDASKQFTEIADKELTIAIKEINDSFLDYKMRELRQAIKGADQLGQKDVNRLLGGLASFLNDPHSNVLLTICDSKKELGGSGAHTFIYPDKVRNLIYQFIKYDLIGFREKIKFLKTADSIHPKISPALGPVVTYLDKLDLDIFNLSKMDTFSLSKMTAMQSLLDSLIEIKNNPDGKNIKEFYSAAIKSIEHNFDAVDKKQQIFIDLKAALDKLSKAIDSLAPKKSWSLFPSAKGAVEDSSSKRRPPSPGRKDGQQ